MCLPAKERVSAEMESSMQGLCWIKSPLHPLCIPGHECTNGGLSWISKTCGADAWAQELEPDSGGHSRPQRQELPAALVQPARPRREQGALLRVGGRCHHQCSHCASCMQNHLLYSTSCVTSCLHAESISRPAVLQLSLLSLAVAR